MGTKGKWKNSSPPPHPNPKLKRKKIKALWLHAEPSHWLHEIFISKTVPHHLWPRIACRINWGYLLVVKTWERNGFHLQYPWRTNCGRTRNLDSATSENHVLHFQNVPILFPTNRGSKGHQRKLTSNFTLVFYHIHITMKSSHFGVNITLVKKKSLKVVSLYIYTYCTIKMFGKTYVNGSLQSHCSWLCYNCGSTLEFDFLDTLPLNISKLFPNMIWITKSI